MENLRPLAASVRIALGPSAMLFTTTYHPQITAALILYSDEVLTCDAVRSAAGSGSGQRQGPG